MTYAEKLAEIQQSAFAELYEINTGTERFFYTSFSRNVDFQANTYQAARIKRNPISFEDKLKAVRTKIKFPLADPMTRYISNNALSSVTIKIYRAFVGDTSKFQVIFDGRVINVEAQKNGASVDCESSSIIFRNKLPSVVHQAFCNHRLFDNGCGLEENDFAIDATVTVNQSQITSNEFANFPDQHFQHGHVVTNYGDYRMITNHIGNTLTLQTAFDTRLFTGSTITAVAGCDKSPGTCRIKFDNFPNFLGFPFIPSNNPVVFGA
jgi:uncharacterized phage protein (TIGR02218 family)